MKKNIQEINQLGSRVEEIGEVMKIINNIADNTKLIAFNAAIEASSAGEAGKRFGIVAVEIRRLAENVVDSTSEIKDKISQIQKAARELIISSEQSSTRIEEGLKQAQSTAKVLKTIMTSSQLTSDATKQIDASTSQQRYAAEQILATLKEIADGIKQFVISVKQTSSVTKKIDSMTDQMVDTVSNLKIDSNMKDK